MSGIAHAAPAGFPAYTYIGTAFNKNNLRYNPTGELIFPCIRGTVGRIANPLARYYLYYAPHDAPGGICLAYGDHLSGQFTEYPYNPIFSRKWPGGPDGISHISSPHVLWNSRVKQFYLYFHGENTVTRVATSTDGINFTYQGGCITEVGLNFDREIHLGVFHNPLSGWPDKGRSAAPSFGTENGEEYMFYEAGGRLDGSIAVAKVL
ncbi:hypothetical protein [Cystobacter fuscus]|uniref:hypothetical protein n=1 Tax=Cystobacter fuscus TaxID=43 RepID=UPI0037BE3706